MYSLLVTHLAQDRSQGTFDLPRDRFLEFTSETISTQLKTLSLEAVECLKLWPCVFMQEGRGEESAYVVRILAVEDVGSNIRVWIEPVPSNPPLLNDALYKMREELDIGQFEFSRNHWAIKDRDLLAVLKEEGYTFEESVVAQFGEGVLPAPTRAEIIGARRAIELWTHADIDDFLLEAGVGGLAAGREVGSRKERANSIVQYAVEHPTATTVENSLFSAFIARAVATGDYGSVVKEDGPPAYEQASRSSNKVFIVHGRNEATRTAVVSLLASFDLKPIVLHEQANMGRHLLTKFIDEADPVTFAVVIMTDDDVGGSGPDALAPRARQNVILELGFFLAHLGQERVCALITPGLETPSDFDGIVYIRMDENEMWKTELERELRAAGMPLS